MSTVRVAFTSTISDSGLAQLIQTAYGIKTGNTLVQVGSGGSGAVLNTGRQGLADVVFAHQRVGEFVFLAERYSLLRQWAFYNYFVIVGPASGPISGTDVLSFINAMNTNWKSGTNNVTFVSRGPNGMSGTYVRELQLWNRAGLIRPAPVVSPGPGIIEASGGAIATLEDMDALIQKGTPNVYTLIDIATFYKYTVVNSSTSLTILTSNFTADTCALNQYVAMPINSGACLPSGTTINTAGAQDFLNWLSDITAGGGQATINSFKPDSVHQGFWWNATPIAPVVPTNEQSPSDVCLIKAVPEIWEG